VPADARVDVPVLDADGAKVSGVRRLAGPVYLHVDLDVLDPSEFTSVGYSAPGGPSVRRVLDVIARVDGVVGASIPEHAPPDDGVDADVVRRIGAAVLARLRA
jgi:arginase